MLFTSKPGAYHDSTFLWNVIIQDDVEIGASCTIDKGVSSDSSLTRHKN